MKQAQPFLHFSCPAEAALRVADCSSRVLQSAHAYVKQQREAQTLAFESRPGEHTSCAASAFLGGECEGSAYHS
eukprot:1156168-Pelagomonas_calceolata.AAC.3